jgi:DNA-binding CsgD family transcriptional regulator
VRQQVFPDLTEREREVLAPIAEHQTNPEIAERLSLSPKMVRDIAFSIFTELLVIDRAQAIIRTREAGLGASERSAGAEPAVESKSPRSIGKCSRNTSRRDGKMPHDTGTTSQPSSLQEEATEHAGVVSPLPQRQPKRV